MAKLGSNPVRVVLRFHRRWQDNRVAVGPKKTATLVDAIAEQRRSLVVRSELRR